MAVAVASVTTDRPERYIKQLISHLGRKIPARLDPHGVGVLDFTGGTVTLSPTPTGLELRAGAGDPDLLRRARQAVASHLVRFATQEDLTVAWTEGK